MWKKFIFLPIANINLTFLMAWPEMKKESLLLDCCGFANIRATDFNIINNWFRKVIEFGKINVLSTFGLRRSFVELISNEFLHPQNHFVTMPDFSKKISGSLCSLLSSSIQKQPFSDVLRKCVLNICSKCTGEHPCRSAVSIKLLCTNCTPAWVFSCNLLHIFRTLFPKNISGWLLLTYR